MSSLFLTLMLALPAVDVASAGSPPDGAGLRLVRPTPAPLERGPLFFQTADSPDDDDPDDAAALRRRPGSVRALAQPTGVPARCSSRWVGPCAPAPASARPLLSLFCRLLL